MSKNDVCQRPQKMFSISSGSGNPRSLMRSTHTHLSFIPELLSPVARTKTLIRPDTGPMGSRSLRETREVSHHNDNNTHWIAADVVTPSGTSLPTHLASDPSTVLTISMPQPTAKSTSAVLRGLPRSTNEKPPITAWGILRRLSLSTMKLAARSM